MAEILRLCLDLNVWCAALLADLKGREDTACQNLVSIVRDGRCRLGEVQLIISWGMLNRLRSVLEEQLKVSSTTADLYINALAGYARSGAIGSPPGLTLGGTGVIGLRDEEDAHVLETAIAGRANILVTANFKDFASKDTRAVIEERHAVYVSAIHKIHIVHPYLMMEWLRSSEDDTFEP